MARPRSRTSTSSVAMPIATPATAFGKYRRGGRARTPKKMFLGGLLGGDAGSTATQSNTVTQSNTAYDPIYTNYAHTVMNTGLPLLDRPYEAYDPTKRFAPTNNDQNQAAAGVRNAQGVYVPSYNIASSNLGMASRDAGNVGTAGASAFNTAAAGPSSTQAANPYLAAGTQAFSDPGVAASYMNPYSTNVVQALQDQSNKNFLAPGGVLNKISDEFTGGGAAQFGRERHGDVVGNAVYNQQLALGNASANALATGYQQGATAFGQDQSRQLQAGQTASGAASTDINNYANLGTARTNAASAGVSSNIAAGGAQTAFGNNLQNANYRDASALQTLGNFEQSQAQRQNDFDYQQNREAFNYPIANAQAVQGLGQGWNVSQSQWGSSSGTTTGGGTSPSGSILGQGLGAASSIMGMLGGTQGISNLFGGGSPNGIPTPASQGISVGGIGGYNMPGDGSGTLYARGGRAKRAFGAGGYAPLVKGVRGAMQKRMPAMMQKLQAQQQQQQGGGPPGGMPPQPQGAFARGGSTNDAAQDRRMVAKGVHQHERVMHKAKPGQLTKLKLRRGGRAFASGGSMWDHVTDMASLGDIPMAPMMRTPDNIVIGAPGGDLQKQQEGQKMQRAFEALRGSGDISEADYRRMLDAAENYRRGGRARYAEGGGYDGAFSLSPESRRLLRLGAAAQNADRVEDYKREAARDPAAYWGDFARSVPRGAAGVGVLAGIPGSIARARGYDAPDWSTMEGINSGIESAFGGPARTSGGRAGEELGETLPSIVGVGSASKIASGARWLNRIRQAAEQSGNAANVVLPAFSR
jgi:hypothetical protein